MALTTRLTALLLSSQSYLNVETHVNIKIYPPRRCDESRQEERRESLQKYMGLFWLFLVGCFEPVLAHHGLVLAHLGSVFARFGPAVGCLDSAGANLGQR